MRMRAIACTLAVVAGPAIAADEGFSFLMGLGRQDFRYHESSATLPVDAKGRSGGPLLVTGALYALDAQTQFSLDSENTFYPGRGHETWTATLSTFNGITLSDPVVQTNGFSLRQSETRLQGHGRIEGGWFGSGGLTMRTLSVKRYAFEPGVDNAVSVPSGATVEESSSEVVATLGLAYDSGPLAGQPQHLGLRVGVGVPLWRRLENTNFPQVVFDEAQGWDLSVEGRWSMAVASNLHLGAWGRAAVLRRGRQMQGAYELPSSRLDSLAAGIELLWKL